MADLSNVRINGARLWDSLMEMAKIGATPKGGCKRLTLTDLDKQGRELFRRWCEAEGCTVKVDEMGNMFARRTGEDPSLPPVIVGSHLDTQPTGGKFDGVLGVLGALEVVRSLNDLKIKTRYPIEVANWTNEEGSRFAPRWSRRASSPAYSPRTSPIRGSTARARRSAANSSASALGARSRSAAGRCMPISSSTSSRGRSSRTRTSISASSPTARASAGTKFA